MGQYAAAVEDCTAALMLDPNEMVAHLQRGRAHAGLEKWDKAVADFTAVVRLTPDSAVGYAHRGNAQLGRGKPEEAVKDYTSLIRLLPTSPVGYSARGDAYRELKKYAHAVADYATAARLSPADADLKAVLAEAVKEVRATGGTPEVVSITLEEEVKSKVVKKSPPIRLAANTEKVVEDTVKLQHEVSLEVTKTLELEVKGKVSAWLAEVETGVRGGVERSVGRMALTFC